jgi:subtilisin family serine protease
MLAVGVHHSVAAGNEGPSAPSIRCPGDCPPPWRHTPEQVATGAFASVTTVGATDSGDAIASFSSRGPVNWETIAPWFDWNDTPPNAGLIDPDVCAPGVGVISCSYSNPSGYTSMDGTSMATPHVAGAMALMLDANPFLSCSQVNQILEETAVDLGAAGKENIFGAGRINALAAVQAALAVGIEQGAGTVPAPGLVISAVTPNPASSVAYFDLYTESGARVVVTVYDIAGRGVAIVSSDDVVSGGNTMSFTIPDNMANGVYIIRATSGSQTATSRLTVLR